MKNRCAKRITLETAHYFLSASRAFAGSVRKRIGEDSMRTKTDSENRPIPFINVTPLIDVLLVLLIIFMVISPLKHTKFEAKLPSQPDHDTRPIIPNPLTLLVTIESDRTLKLNSL